jgi:hypothetical protein
MSSCKKSPAESRLICNSQVSEYDELTEEGEEDAHIKINKKTNAKKLDYSSKNIINDKINNQGKINYIAKMDLNDSQ